MRKVKVTSLISVAVVAASLIIPIQSAQAACKPVKPSGRTVGEIQVGSLKMPIKPFNYPAGGIMEPQKSTQMLAMSQRHQPLEATMGTTVLAWHVNFAGCINPLNTLTNKNVGFEFQIRGEDDGVISYTITNKFKVKKGNYKQNWFNVIGPRQLLLVTCGGPFRDGHYQENVVVIAKPTEEI
jgi:hypothetical protein